MDEGLWLLLLLLLLLLLRDRKQAKSQADQQCARTRLRNTGFIPDFL